MLLDILKYPNPLLKQSSRPVARVDQEIRKLVDNLFETMYAAPGVGLAAPQVGILQRILVIDVGRLEGETRHPDPRAIINPAFTSREGTITWEEGCLSCPELLVPMERSQKVIVEGLDPDGKHIKILGEDLLAVAFQHEIDHLDGILLVDRLSRLKRDFYKKKLLKEEPSPRETPAKKSQPAYIG